MDRPELPAHYYWQDRSTINVKREDGGTENVAWYWGPGEVVGRNENTYACVSAPVKSLGNYYERHVDTEDEAVALIVSFALLGITKE